jgi:hypothetical protein
MGRESLAALLFPLPLLSRGSLPAQTPPRLAAVRDGGISFF